MTALPTAGDCWNSIGVWGDRSCPELATVTHCQNCPVFASAGRRFLDAPSPPGYLDEWTDRLTAPVEESAAELDSLLVFRLADEWLALSVHALVEVATPRPIRRVPGRSGLLAGIVNIRGELHLCARLAKLLGIEGAGVPERLLVVRRGTDGWVFPVDEVARVRRVPRRDIGPVPATVGRSSSHLSRGVFAWDDRAVGILDDGRLFDALRTRLR
jgi:chemotaxis-related protein WspD